MVFRMGKINVLSSKVYNRIAAGEVIERPSSVIKELVENSIDAGATEVCVEIEAGGISFIKVSDNGCGIDKDDLLKSLLPHATSKILKVSDLDNIVSLGFRGEALASIASISKINVKSKPLTQSIGAEIYSEGGQIAPISDCASPNGTEITVKNLFYNTPVRAKFLKTERSEENEITALVTRFILGNPNIAIKYIADGKVCLQSFGDGVESAFVCVYGASVVKDCFYIDVEKHGIRIKGYIGKHYFTKPTRGYQTIFLNNRYVVNQTIASAISNAYSAYLMKRQYPFYSLSISVPTEIVDVNVHPNKTDVRFSNNQIIYGTVYSVISKVLDGSSEAINIVLENHKEKTSDIQLDYVINNAQKQPKSEKNYKFDSVLFNDSAVCEKVNDVKTQNNSDIFAENKAFLEQLEKGKINTKSTNFEVFNKETSANKQQIKNNYMQEQLGIERDLVFVGQALNTFLIYQDSDNLFLIDQHAAHERILFDKLNKSFDNNDIIVQPLLIPFVLTVNGNEASFINEKTQILTQLGFEISDFGNNTFKISGIPSFLSNINLQEFFDELLFDMDNLKQVTTQSILKERLAQKACKSAIKAGDKMSESETKCLLDLLKNNLGLKCPHGRPIAIKITKTEIEKWFKRIV